MYQGNMQDMTVCARWAIILTLAVCITGAATADETQHPEASSGVDVTATNRPFRDMRRLTLTVGQDAGDLQGSDDKVIQAAIDYVYRLGGGAVCILPGVYDLRNALYLRPDITLKGSGEKTVLRKTDSVVTALSRDCDWYEYAVQVESTTGFTQGAGVMLRSRTGPGDWQYDVLRATVTSIDGNVLFLDRMAAKNFWTQNKATAATIFPLLTAEGVDDVAVEDIVLDGNRDHNEHINGNYAGAVFIQNCNRWRFTNVVARRYNGDGFSFQVCDDIHFVNCRAVDNADLGFHPGSGSQRPVFLHCDARGNSQGIFFCWGVSNGQVVDCNLSGNARYGISIGHRDTDNLITGCTIERNGEVGILLRQEGGEFRGGHRNRIEGCRIRDNGVDRPGIGIDIQGQTHDLVAVNNRLESSAGGRQETGIRIGAQARRIYLENNTYEGCPVQTEDMRTQPLKP